jgi:hypothetical protein
MDLIGLSPFAPWTGGPRRDRVSTADGLASHYTIAGSEKAAHSMRFSQLSY